MADYMFMLESHLTVPRRQAAAAVEAAAAESDEQLFLTGGAMRDMLGGFPIGDLDFVVQGNALALAKKAARMVAGTKIVSTDTVRQSAELVFPGGVTAEIAMARTERFPRPGASPVVKPASIHEDLQRRDFTINSIALSFHAASRGLLLDPNNGQADLERRELRAISSYGFYDDPLRLLRLIRFRVRFDFSVESRTQQQYANAREAAMETRIPVRDLAREFRSIANESKVGEVTTALAEEGLLTLFSPALSGPKLNLAALAKLEKAKQMIPYWVDLNLNNLEIFLYFLTEKLSPKEKAALARRLKITKAEQELWQKLEARSRRLGAELRSRKLHRASELYRRLREAPGDEILFLYLRAPERIVRDRIRTYLQKYLFVVQEVTDRDVSLQAGVEPASPEFSQIKEEMIAARLDGRKWTPPIKSASGSSARKKPSSKAARKKRAGSQTASPATAPAKSASGSRRKTARAATAPAKSAPGSRRKTARAATGKRRASQ